MTGAPARRRAPAAGSSLDAAPEGGQLPGATGGNTAHELGHVLDDLLLAIGDTS